MNLRINQIHQRALVISQTYKKSEQDLLSILQEIDKEKVFLHLKYKSLYEYAHRGLGLPEGVVYNLINVARKSVQVPELKAAVLESKLSVSTARRIVPVLNSQNKDHWIKLAQTLPKRELEREVAKVSPQVATPEKSKFVTDSRLKLELGVSVDLMAKIKRVQDLISQKTKRPASIEMALEEMTEMYLKRNDLLRIAKRVVERKIEKLTERSSLRKPEKSDELGPGQVRKPIKVHVKHEINLRDSAQCTAKDCDGNRCESTRWLDIHHIKPVSLGGDNSLNNLTLLCHAHHKMEHLHSQ